jgi:ABC-type bacteriocin/lantibiotic exporter with double-glycine peptidase domain
MGTDARGTTLSALAETAWRHGLAAQGLWLTQAGLARTLAAPRSWAVALVMPGHYVVVESAGPGGVTVWDPDGGGRGRGARRALGLAEWQGQWEGTTLALTPIKPNPAGVAAKASKPVRTAHR